MMMWKMYEENPRMVLKKKMVSVVLRMEWMLYDDIVNSVAWLKAPNNMRICQHAD